MATEAELESASAAAGSAGDAGALSAAERARAERQRLRARELRAARLALHAAVDTGSGAAAGGGGGGRLLDTGGGFLLDTAAAAPPPRAAPAPPAPPAHRSEWPPCEECGARIAASQLLEQFSLAVCDACRQPDGKHALLTRTEAKAEFLLKDCDLDKREPPLRCVRRRNPHARGGAAGDMRLYVRAQLEARAALVWGGDHALAAERARREQRRAEARAAKYSRELRALRRGVRPAPRAAAAHAHEWTDERATDDDDVYQHTCRLCGLTQTFEKM